MTASLLRAAERHTSHFPLRTSTAQQGEHSPRRWYAWTSQPGALSGLDRFLAFLASVLAGSIYWLGAAPGVLFGDGGELQFAAWLAGLPHPTGYPLYMLLGWAWTHLLDLAGLASPARAMNLLSVLFAAATVGLAYLLNRLLIETSLPRSSRWVQRLAALTAALTFAFTPTFWSQALVAEVYALHALFVTLLLGLALRWRMQAQASQKGKGIDWEEAKEGSRPERPAASLLLLAFFFGLSLAHHRTAILLAPVLLVFVWRQERGRLRRPAWLLLGLLAALPLLFYLYVPLREAQTPYLTLELAPGQTVDLINRTPRGWAGYILGRAFAGELQGPGAALARLPGLGPRFIAELGPVALGLAAIGLAWLVSQRRRSLLLLTGGSFLLFSGFNLFYAIGDIHVFYIPSYVLVTCWLGVGVAFIAGELEQFFLRWPRTRPRGAQLAGLMLLFPLIALPGALFLDHASSLDRSGYTWPEAWWRSLLEANPPANAILISNDRDEMMPLWYLQQVDGVRPDLTGLFPKLIPGEGWSDVGKVAEIAVATGRPAALIKPMPGLEVKIRLGPADAAGLTLVEGLAVSGEPQRPESALIGEGLRLNGYDVAPLQVQPGETLSVELYWQPLQRIPVDLTSFVHLETLDGVQIAQSDKPTGGDYYPTSRWKPGEWLLDEHRLKLPADAPAGPYRLIAGMYRLAGEEAQAVGSVELTGKVGGKRPSHSQGIVPANPFYANLDDQILLVGYELSGQRLAFRNSSRLSSAETPSQDLAVTLLWQAARPMANDYTVFVHLLDQTGAIVAQRDVEPFDGLYPTSVWLQGQLLADSYTLLLPETLPPGDYDLLVGLYVARTQQRLPAYDDFGQRFSNDRILLTEVELR